MAASGRSLLAVARFAGSQKGLPEALPDGGIDHRSSTGFVVMLLLAPGFVPACSLTGESLLSWASERSPSLPYHCSRLPSSRLAVRFKSCLTWGLCPLPPPSQIVLSEPSETRRTRAPVFGTPLNECCSHIWVGLCGSAFTSTCFAIGLRALEPLLGLFLLILWFAWHGIFCWDVTLRVRRWLHFHSYERSCLLNVCEYAFRGVLCLWPCVFVLQKALAATQHNKTCFQRSG